MEVQIFEYTRFEMSDANAEVNEFLYDLKNWKAEINYVKQSLVVNKLIISIWYTMPEDDYGKDAVGEISGENVA